MKTPFKVFLALCAVTTVVSCQQPSELNSPTLVDNQSFAEINNAKITHLLWDVEVDFEHKLIKGSAEYDFENNNANSIVFDTDHLIIDSVQVQGNSAKWELAPRDSIKGSALRVFVTEVDSVVKIFYKTTPKATALQWLEPSQTHDKKYPFLLTQGQPILTRSYIPIQDTPSIRLTYDAVIKVPKDLMPVMSATNAKEKNQTGVYHLEMDQPIAPYLIALAVGDIHYKAIDQRTGVYAEQGLLSQASWELAQLDTMLQAAEELYGPYPWKQYDVLILPPSFPFGGMENPRLTFATPTILVGDRSLTNLIAHELAHSWSGNLVTNATWDDFWLNEGFTVYFERRIMEKVFGKDYADMISVNGYQDLQTSMNLIDNHFTSLYVDLQDRNPDDAFSDVPYDKGYLFLKMLEDRYTRDTFDIFVQKYFADNAFQTMTTTSFVEYLKENLTNGQDDFIQNWIYDTGWPMEFQKPTSLLLDQVDLQYKEDVDLFAKEGDLQKRSTNWSTNQFVHYIRQIDPQSLTKEDLAKMDQLYDFTNSQNAEIQCAWFEKAFLLHYDVVNENATGFMTRVGRRKFLEPLYLALVNSGQLDLANQIYAQARDNYHFIARQTIDNYLNYSVKQ